jgi:dissimilatory sulfite reductase related protein
MEPAEVLGERLRTVAGREILFDEEGFLVHPEDWTEDVAQELAAEAGVEKLDETQWMVIGFLREFYFDNGRSPLNRAIVKGVGMTLLELECLFPDGIRHGAKRLAGLPNPKRCS